VVGVEVAVVTEVMVTVEAEAVCGAGVCGIPSQSSIHVRANSRVKGAVFSRAVAVADAAGPVVVVVVVAVEAGVAETVWGAGAAAPEEARR
jgi:hypothetical protein